MTTPFDANGNPDIMGSRQMTPVQLAAVDALRLEFNALHQKLAGDPTIRSEQSRLYAIARTHLETAAMFAIKAASRAGE